MVNEFGVFTNKTGYSLFKLRDERYAFLFSKAIYEFTLDPDDPLTYTFPDGRRLRPDRHCETDMGSTPHLLRLFFPKDRFLLSYIFHDSAYRHGGLFMAKPTSCIFEFVEMTRKQKDLFLLYAMRAEGGWPWDRYFIWSQVRIWGGLKNSKDGKK